MKSKKEKKCTERLFDDGVLLQSAVLKTRSYNQCLLAISVDSLAEVKHGGVVALKRFSISNYKHR